MSRKIEIHGSKDYIEEIENRLGAFKDIIEVRSNLENIVIIDGDIPPKEALYFGKLLGEKVFWKIHGALFDIYNVERLQKEQDCALRKYDWKTVKQINKIIMEVELFRRESNVHFFPTKIQVEHSTICNAKCIMCTHYFTDNYKRSFIQDDTINGIIPVLPYIDKILLHGIGEAFLHPNIKRYLEIYAKFDVDVSCVTNMTHMNPELAEVIGKSFHSITVSCDGATKQTFESIRRGISFEDFCNHVRLLHELQPTLEIRFNVVCMRQNIMEMPQIMDLAAELGVSTVGISGLIAQKILDNLDDEIRFYPEVAAHYLKEALKKAQKHGIRILQFPDYVFQLQRNKSFEEELDLMMKKPLFHPDTFRNELYERYRKIDVIKPTEQADLVHYAQSSQYACIGICDYFAESPFIGVNGDVTSCCIDGVHIMGDLKKKSFSEIWNNEVYRKMRRIFYQGNLPKYCVGCMFLKDHTNTNRIMLSGVNNSFFENRFSDLIDSFDRGKGYETGNMRD